MRQTLTTEEIIRYITLSERTPETVRFVVEVNALLAKDEALRRRVSALEALYDTLASAPTAEKRALLLEYAQNDEGMRMR